MYVYIYIHTHIHTELSTYLGSICGLCRHGLQAHDLGDNVSGGNELGIVCAVPRRNVALRQSFLVKAVVVSPELILRVCVCVYVRM